MGINASPCAAGCLALASAHPETPGETKCVSDLETSNFLPDQGNQAFERRRSTIRRTNKCAGGRRAGEKGPFPDRN